MNKITPFIVAFLLPATYVGLQANPTIMHQDAREVLAQDTVGWDQKLPFDKEVRQGKLKNGFTYFIRKNVEPKSRVTMFLANKVGSILESDDQVGLAHFLEHMNFNGLKHFPKNELVNYLQSAGVRFGSDLNAYTGFDETVYQLPIPSDDPELLKNGMQVLRDWAQDALLTNEEIDKERGIVLEEMRGGRGAQQRMQDKYFPLMLNGSRYASRLPIGTEDNIKNFKYETLRKFHQDWYRPDLQALIIVGDIDVDQMEAEVKRLFSDLKTPKKPVPRTEHTVDLLNKNQFMVVTDPENAYTIGQIYIKHPEEKVSTVKDYRSQLHQSLFLQMLNARLSELSQSANPPFLQAGVNIGEFIGGLACMNAYFVAKPNEFEAGFKAVVRELDRVKRFGFNESEFIRAKSALIKGNETAYVERDKKKSENYVNEYLGYFLKDGIAMSNADDYLITKQLLPTLTLRETEAIGTKNYVDQNRDIIIMAPEKEKDLLPNEELVNNWYAELSNEELIAYDDKVSELPLLQAEPQKGALLSSKAIDGIDAKEIILSNGVKVILKPTKFKNDELMFSASSPGGTSLYSDSDYLSAAQSADLVNGSGVGQLNTLELQKYLTGKKVNVSPFIGERSEGLSGVSDKEGLKTMFEMIYAYFTAPRIEDDIFQSTITKAKSMIQNRANNPDFVFQEAVLNTLYPNNLRRLPISAAGIDQIDQQRALAVYKERFADASDFTFTFVGSFSEEELKPYLEAYIAALPALKRQEKPVDLGIYEPAAGVEKIVYKGQEEKAQVRLSYYGDYSFNALDNLTFKALQGVLSIRLLERLREEESGVYGTGAQVSTSKFPKNRYSLHIGFGTSVAQYRSLIASALDEIAAIKKDGPSQLALDKFVIEQKRQFELQLKENRFWMGQLANAYQLDEDPAYVNKYLSDLEKITPESIKALANKYIKDENLFKFILLPEAK